MRKRHLKLYFLDFDQNETETDTTSIDENVELTELYHLDLVWTQSVTPTRRTRPAKLRLREDRLNGQWQCAARWGLVFKETRHPVQRVSFAHAHESRCLLHDTPNSVICLPMLSRKHLLQWKMLFSSECYHSGRTLLSSECYHSGLTVFSSECYHSSLSHVRIHAPFKTKGYFTQLVCYNHSGLTCKRRSMRGRSAISRLQISVVWNPSLWGYSGLPDFLHQDWQRRMSWESITDKPSHRDVVS